jgi:hypothetical protein
MMLLNRSRALRPMNITRTWPALAVGSLAGTSACGGRDALSCANDTCVAHADSGTGGSRTAGSNAGCGVRELLQNPSFDTGATGWTQSTPSSIIVSEVYLVGVTAHSSPDLAYLGGFPGASETLP